MEELYPIMGNKTNWTIIGSSFGGLMGAIFTCEQPDKVEKLVMLAPALMLPQFKPYLDISTSLSAGRKPVSVPTTIIHGKQDEIVPLEEVRRIAQKVFTDLTYKIVDDDHGLHKTADAIDWKSFLA
jgi:pimeloyl-ACP methyl ester carboxylesterase